MRIGLPEIALIIVAIIVIIVVARMFRAKSDPAKQNDQPPARATKRRTSKKANRMWIRLRRAGIVLIVISVILMLAGTSMFRWILQSYIWTFSLLVIGLVMLLMSWRK